MYITWAELFQFGLVIIGIVSVFATANKKK